MLTDTMTVEKFFKSCGEREDEMRRRDTFIQQATNLQPVYFKGMGNIKTLGYKLLDYKTKSAPKSSSPIKWPLVAIAAQKNYIAIYICAVQNNKYLTENYYDKLGKVNCGKSCIRFKKFDDLNQYELANLLKDADQLEHPFGYVAH